MKRDELRSLIKSLRPAVHPKGRPWPKQAKDKVRQALIDYFRSEAGQEAIRKAPPWHRDRSPEELADLLLSEVERLDD